MLTIPHLQIPVRQPKRGVQVSRDSGFKNRHKQPYHM